MTVIFGVFFVCGAYLFPNAFGSCLSHAGKPISWWLLYQQKQKPFTHYYIESTNKDRVLLHFPEKADSVLSRVVTSLIEKEDIEYMVYSSDLKNTRTIAESLQLPMYSKFMNGIIGSDTSWTSGFWILHNNLFFPLATRGKWLIPGSKQWKLSTMGDSNADIFYFCLKAGSTEDMKIILRKVLAGNPYIFLSRLYGDTIHDINLQAVTSLNSSFALQWSAFLFMNCLYANENETSTNCLLIYSESSGTQVSVYTRPRGMIRHSKAFCYNDRSKSAHEFVDLQHTSTNNADWTNSMFTLTDDQESSLSGVTCFGQDIAANTETVAIMVCLRLPQLYKTMLKFSKISHWPCLKGKSSGDRRHILPVENLPSLTTNKKTSPYSSFSTKSIDNQKQISNLFDSDDPEEKYFVKFCDLVNCNIKNSNSYSKQLRKTKDLSTVFQGSDKLKRRLEDIVSDIHLGKILMFPSKTNKKKPQCKTTIQIKTKTDIVKYIVSNENSVLGLFCRDGCAFCQKTKEEFALLGDIEELQLLSFDIVIVDINDPNLPEWLITPWVPYIRYKLPGTDSEWLDYKETDYTLMKILMFLQSVTSQPREKKKQGLLSEDPKEDIDEITVSSAKRMKRSTGILKLTNKRRNDHRRFKRSVIKQEFTSKHLWYVSADHFQTFREAKNSESQMKWVFLVSCTRLARLAKHGDFRATPRKQQDFIVIKQEKKKEVEKYLLNEAKSGKGIIHKDNKGNDRVTFNTSLDEINADLLLVRIKYIYKPDKKKKSLNFEITNFTSICIKDRGQIALGGDGIQLTIDHFAAYYTSDQDNAPNNVCIVPPNKLLKGTRDETRKNDIDDIETYEPWCEQFNVTLSVDPGDDDNCTPGCLDTVWNACLLVYSIFC